MGIFWGLLCALSWGITDFLIKPVAMKLGAMRAAFYTELLGMLPVLFLMIVFRERIGTVNTIILAMLIGVLNFIATIALYKAYKAGEISLLAPVVSTYNAITVLLAVILLGERPSLADSLGILLTILGVVLVSTTWSEVKQIHRLLNSPGFGWALIAALAFGLTFFSLDYVVSDDNFIAPIFLFRVVSVMGLLITRPIKHFSLKFPNRSIWWLLALLVIADNIGYFTYNLGINSDYVAIVSTLSSLYVPISVLLAFLILKERPERLQKLGIATVIGGTLLIVV